MARSEPAVARKALTIVRSGRCLARLTTAAGVLGAEVWVQLVAPPTADTPAPTDPAVRTWLTVTT
jgi:hypothetical protein